MKDSELNGSTLFPNLICSWFNFVCHFDFRFAYRHNARIKPWRQWNGQTDRNVRPKQTRRSFRFVIPVRRYFKHTTFFNGIRYLLLFMGVKLGLAL